MSSRIFPRLACILAAAAALSACGSQAPDRGVSAGPDAADPPGAALPLSIGNAARDDGADAFAAAVNCAAALEITRERLVQMSTQRVSREIDLIGRAKDYFEAQAEEAAETGSDGMTSPQAAIARRKREKQDETTQQAQLAISCLRGFGEQTA